MGSGLSCKLFSGPFVVFLFVSFLLFSLLRIWTAFNGWFYFICTGWEMAFANNRINIAIASTCLGVSYHEYYAVDVNTVACPHNASRV